MTLPLKVMMVDDDSTTLEILAAVLEQRGHTVLQRDTAIGTTLAIIREAPDVVVLDVRMPGLTGDKLAGLIAAREDDPPIVLLHSSVPRTELEELARKSGAQGVIEKTGNPQEFVRSFDAIVGPLSKKRSRSGGGRKEEP
jgi:CheY-like chemotaxis protein